MARGALLVAEEEEEADEVTSLAEEGLCLDLLSSLLALGEDGLQLELDARRVAHTRLGGRRGDGVAAEGEGVGGGGGVSVSLHPSRHTLSPYSIHTSTHTQRA